MCNDEEEKKSVKYANVTKRLSFVSLKIKHQTNHLICLSQVSPIMHAFKVFFFSFASNFYFMFCEDENQATSITSFFLSFFNQI